MIRYAIEIWIMLFLCTLMGCSIKNNAGGEPNKVNAPEYAIAYNVLADSENDNYEVFTMNLDGSEKRNITNLAGVEWTYHSNGDRLYFISDKDTAHRHYFLYTCRFDGSEFKKVSNVRLMDSWLSTRNNGNEILVGPHPSVDTAFYILNGHGDIITVLKPELAYVSDPIFSPDGQRIVFRGSDKAFKQESGYIDELYVMDANGGNLRRLTTYPDSDTTSQWFNYHAGPPKWHPTEGFISYGSFQDGTYSLFKIDVDGDNQQKLIDDEGRSIVWHDWSPDGKWLVIDYSDHDQPPFHIGLINWETKRFQRLTDSTYRYHQAPNFVLKNF